MANPNTANVAAGAKAPATGAAQAPATGATQAPNKGVTAATNGAEKAKRAKKNSKNDAIRAALSPEDQAKFDALQRELAAERKSIEARKRQKMAALGISVKPMRLGSGLSLSQLPQHARVTVVPGGSGFKNDEDKAIASKIGEGVTVADLAKIDGVNYDWFRYRFTRGGVKFNGMTFNEVLAKSLGT